MLELHFTNDRIPKALPISGTRHQIVSLRIAAALLLYAEGQNLGQVLSAPCDVVLSSEVAVYPDIVFLKANRMGLVGEKSLWGAPDLIIEIASVNTREQDAKTKRSLYSRFAVPEYWIVDPDAEIIEVLSWSEMGYATAGVYRKMDRLSSPALPGFRLPLRKVFGR